MRNKHKIGVLGLVLMALLAFSWRFVSTSSDKIITSKDPIYSIPDYPFVNYTANQLQFPGGTDALLPFYQKLDTLLMKGQGHLTILHMGGSHVQAGTLTQRLRENFYTLGEGIKGERGFLFPFKLAHTNNPRNYKVTYTGSWKGCRSSRNSDHCNWGLSGINASTSDTLNSFKLYALSSDSSIYPFNRVRIFHEFPIEPFTVSLKDPAQVDSSSIDTLSGVTSFWLKNTMDTLELVIRKKTSEHGVFTLQGISLENDDQIGITYTAIGVNGAKTSSYLKGQNFQNQLNYIKPDLVIFALGINDSYVASDNFSQEAYEDNYRQLIQKFHASNSTVSFVFLTNNDSYYRRRTVNTNVFAARESMRKLATEYRTGYWDLFEIMGGLNSIKAWQNEGLAKADLIHFTPAGYVLQADLFYKAFRENYGDYLETTRADSLTNPSF